MNTSKISPDTMISRWQELCKLYLPISQPETIWRYSRRAKAGDVAQGWKLHLSATPLTATQLLERVGPFLHSREIQFKGPGSLAELDKLNTGLHYGYSQIGKCLTVYPGSDKESVAIAEELHSLTLDLPAPAIPFDFRLKPKSSVYYRYGVFQQEAVDGETTSWLKGPAGQTATDRRDSAAFPSWVENPFPKVDSSLGKNPLTQDFQIFHALSQRGKGGVYLALDCRDAEQRVVIVKEGRKNGEPYWDGRDGAWRVRNEMKNLLLLKSLGMDVPEVYTSFEIDDNFYLVTEFIQASNLKAYLSRRKRKLTVSQSLGITLQMAEFLAKLHSHGWVWRDCKPANFAIDGRKTLRPFDFEGACPEGTRNAISWATPEFSSPQVAQADYYPAKADDVYSLGVILFFLLTARYPDTAQPDFLAKQIRRQLPGELITLMISLLSLQAEDRHSAEEAARVLISCQ